MRKGTLLVSAICILIVGVFAGAVAGNKFHFFAPETPVAEALLARVGHTFVASSPPPDNRLIGRWFYTDPKPWGVSWLCRVDVVYISPWIVWNYPKPVDKSFEDDISVKRLFGVNGQPGQEVRDEDYDTSCSKFRDFDNLIVAGDGDDPHRAVFVLDKIIDSTQTRTPDFEIECTDRRWEGRPPCDGARIIGELSLKNLSQTTNDSEVRSRGSTTVIDSLYFQSKHRGGEHPQMTTLVVESKQTIGKQSIEEPDIRAVHVYLDAL